MGRSWVILTEEDWKFLCMLRLRDLKNNLKQYDRVSPAMDTIRAIEVNLLNKKDWPIRICSLEKNPAVKIRPIKLLRLILILITRKGLSVLELTKRASCCENLLWSNLPITIKRLALAKACIQMWKKQMIGSPNASDINISPNCLSVDSATTFFASTSIKAESLATSKVKVPKVPHKKTLKE